MPLRWSDTNASRPQHPCRDLLLSHGVKTKTRSQISDAFRASGGKVTSTQQHSIQQSQGLLLEPQFADLRIPLPLYPTQHLQLQTGHQRLRQQQLEPPTHYGSRALSLSRALHLHPSQAAQMMREYPALSNFNHASLADKVHEIASMLQLPPQRLAPVLVRKPRVLGASLQALEARVDGLVRIFGNAQVVQQLVVQDPTWLTWSPKHLRKRLNDMSLSLGIGQELLQLLQLHPQLLDASRWLVQSLGLIQQLLQLASGRQADVCGKTAGLAVGSSSAQLRQPHVQQHSQQQQQQQQQSQRAAPQQQQQQQHAPGEGPVVPVREFAVQHPLLLLMCPDQVQARIATMQAQSGLALSEVAAAIVANPSLLYGEPSRGGNSRLRSSHRRNSNSSRHSPAAAENSIQYSSSPWAEMSSTHAEPSGRDNSRSNSGSGSSSSSSSNSSSHCSNSGRSRHHHKHTGKQYWHGLRAD